MKKYYFTILILADALLGWSQSAQVAAAPAGANKLSDIMTMMLTIAGSALFIVAMIYVIKVNQFLYKRVVRLEAEKSGVAMPVAVAAPEAAKRESFWTQMRKKYWEDAVPVEREGEITLGHAYDGIRELDNKLPPWWVNMFILTIIWAVGYMYFYHWGGNGPSSTEEYTMEMEAAKKEMAVALAGKPGSAIDESNVTRLTEAGPLSEGELIYKTTCAACHGQLGEGTVGPNFTDEYWIHGGGIKDLFRTIKYGVPEKGMISWQAQLKPDDMQKVASYILTLKGTNPPNPKAPQGTIWKEEAAAPDSTKVE